MKVSQGPKTFKVEIDGNLCFETDKVKLPAGYHFGVSAVTSDTPDSFELFSILVSSPEKFDTSRNQQDFDERDNVGQDSEAQQAHGRTPHEQDYQEYVPEYQDTAAEIYKTPEQQFTDLHDRLQGMVGRLYRLLLRWAQGI